MRIMVTFILINLLTVGMPESIYVDKSSDNTVVSLPVSSYAPKSNEKEILEKPEQLEKEFPVNNKLISIKIYNERGEVIEKWQGKSNRVIPNSMAFLKKASKGTYLIKGILIDGSESEYLLVK